MPEEREARTGRGAAIGPPSPTPGTSEPSQLPPPPPGAPPGAPPPGHGPSDGTRPPPEAGPEPNAAGGTSGPIGARLLPLRPLTISDILDGAFRGLRATFLPASLLVVVLIGPLQLGLNLALSRVIPAATGPEIFFDIEAFEETVVSVEDLMSMANVTLAASVLGFVITLLVSVAVIALILQVDRGEEPNVRSAVTDSWRSVLVTLVSSALALLAGMVAFATWLFVLVLAFTVAPLLGLLLLLVSLPTFVIGGGAYFGYLHLLVPIAVVEGRGVMATMGRAWWVLRSRFWRVVGLSLLVGLLVTVVGGALQFPFVISSMFVGSFGWIVQSVGEILSQVISIPVTMFAVLLIYLDARVRLEGLDLQLRMRSFGPS